MAVLLEQGLHRVEHFMNQLSELMANKENSKTVKILKEEVTRVPVSTDPGEGSK